MCESDTKTLLWVCFDIRLICLDLHSCRLIGSLCKQRKSVLVSSKKKSKCSLTTPVCKLRSPHLSNRKDSRKNSRCRSYCRSLDAVLVRKFAKSIPVWIREGFNCSPSHDQVLRVRLEAAKTWSDYVRRVTTLCHVAKEARKTLKDPITVSQVRTVSGAAESV